jgi:hypothetical protein
MSESCVGSAWEYEVAEPELSDASETLKFNGINETKEKGIDLIAAELD